ncbi:hypothetical protein ACOSP7_024575 [Xanthoceras sorbifolium]|uniref:Protein LURP-one-related 17 n=1 Tax=Xanthoceras sorbifolium TaxID=99658 RepID=A0ABQ8H8H9_9ROSI|nr:hypothetical protein JRO89_XS13G0155300 [Xanthoceras sorbifolium]
MFLFLKSLSRSVHEEQEEPENLKNTDQVNGKCMSLTVWRKSLIISCNGFTVIDSQGNLVYRVDNYIGHPEELTLMDGSGKSVLTMRRRKKLTMVDSWHVYVGEGDDHENCSRTTTELSKTRPIYCVKKHISILQSDPSVLAYVRYGSSSKRFAYTVEGSYVNRSCKVLDESRRVVAEIKRKEAAKKGVSFGVDVFILVVEPGFDPGFAMALVLLLDQMFS